MPVTKSKTPSKSIYSVHPSIAMVQSTIAKLKEKTGRSLDEWLVFIQKNGPKDEAARQDWLKKEHGLGTNYCGWLAAWSVGKDAEDGDPRKYLQAAAQYVEEMYAGGKVGLRPIHDALIDLGRSLGKDVKVCPCKTIVPFFRHHVFAQVKPSTRTRIDLGLCLKDHKGKLPARIVSTGGADKGDRITHCIPITSINEIDHEVEKWLGVAYQLDA